MWGIGYKHYPFKWFIPMLKRFYNQHTIDKIVSLPILLGWVMEGKVKAKGAGLGWGHPHVQGDDTELE